MGRPSRKILELREAAEKYLEKCYQRGDPAMVAAQGIVTTLAADFNVTPEVALTQVRHVHYKMTHGKPPHRGRTNDTGLYLGPERCAWLKAHGGKQPTIKKLIDWAMKEETFAKLALGQIECERMGIEDVR